MQRKKERKKEIKMSLSLLKFFCQYQKNNYTFDFVIEEIFNKIYSSSKIDSYLKKNRCYNIDDIKQQVSLNILEKGDEFILKLHNSNKLQSYFFVSCVNLFRTEIKARKDVVDIDLVDCVDQLEYEEISIDFDKLEQQNWYKANVALKITDVNIGTIANLSSMTKIPYNSLRRTFELTRKIIKDNGEKYIKRTIINPTGLD
jgi:hypothetical protein